MPPLPKGGEVSWGGLLSRPLPQANVESSPGGPSSGSGYCSLCLPRTLARAASRAHLPGADAGALPPTPRPRHERPISGGSRGQAPPPPHPSLGAVAICSYACPGAWGWGRGGGGMSRGFGHAHRDRKAVWHGPGRLTLSTHSPARQPSPWEPSPDFPTSPRANPHLLQCPPMFAWTRPPLPLRTLGLRSTWAAHVQPLGALTHLGQWMQLRVQSMRRPPLVSP